VGVASSLCRVEISADLRAGHRAAADFPGVVAAFLVVAAVLVAAAPRAGGK
jgi:hypothetical protein